MHSSQGNGHSSTPRSHQGRAPGSFSPLPGLTGSSSNNYQHSASRTQQHLSKRPPPPLQIETSASLDNGAPLAAMATSQINASKPRQRAASPATPIYNQFTSQSNASTSSLHNFSRPTASPRAVTHGSSSPLVKSDTRKFTATQGMFDSTLPSTSVSNLSQATFGSTANPAHAAGSLSASQIAAQAAVMSHQNGTHFRQRSQTVPFPGDGPEGSRRSSGSQGPANPPNNSDAASRDGSRGVLGGLQADRLGNAHSSAATTAANVVFPRSSHGSPREPTVSPPFSLAPPPPPKPAPEKPLSKSEKAKAKLFSRPVKLVTSKSDIREKALPSPSKIGSALSVLQRGNFSTSSLVDSSAQSLYSLTNSSSATIRPTDHAAEEKGKEKKHHFLSRQKQKLKDEYHLNLSSAASNSKPTDPSAPSSLYNFNIPSSAGPSSTSFTKGRKDKKHGERSESRLDNESTFNLAGDWSTTSSFPPLSVQSSVFEQPDHGRIGLGVQSTGSLEEAWPFLKKKLLVIFDGDDIRLPIEDINRLVQLHIQYCIHRRSSMLMIDDLRDLLKVGFSSLDRTLRSASEDRFLPTLVELWLFTFTSILPYLQSAFLPLDLEVAGRGTLLTTEQARDFWTGSTSSATAEAPIRAAPASVLFDVRRLVLNAYRDVVVLPHYEALKAKFSRLTLEFLPSSAAAAAANHISPALETNASTSPPEYFPPMARPGTAMSLDPSVASYNSSSTTVFGDGSAGGRSRAVSNVSYGSHGSEGGMRPFTPSGRSALSSVREQNVDDSKQVTDMVARMLQCMSVLAGVGSVGGADSECYKKMVELCKMLKLNWLGRGRTGRNRRGIVGGRVRREDVSEELRVV